MANNDVDQWGSNTCENLHIWVGELTVLPMSSWDLGGAAP